MATNNVGVFDTVTINKQLILTGTASTTSLGPITTGNTSISGTLGVTGATTLAGTTTGAISTGAATLGATTATTLGTSGLATLASSSTTGNSAVTGTSALTGRVTGVGGFTSSSTQVSGVNSATYTTVFALPGTGARGIITILSPINSSGGMLTYFFEYTPGSLGIPSYNLIASSGSANPAAPGIGPGGTMNLTAQVVGGYVLQVKTTIGSGSVNVDVIYF